MNRRTGPRLKRLLLVAAALVFELAFLVWLMWPSHYPINNGPLAYYLSMAMVTSIGAIEQMRLLNIVTLCYATLNAREGNDPDVKAMCAELGVHHFSRKATRSGTSRAGTTRPRPSTAVTTRGSRPWATGTR